MKRATLALAALLFALPSASQAMEEHFDIEIPDEAPMRIEPLVGCNMVGAAETASLMGLLALGLPLFLRRREER